MQVYVADFEVFKHYWMLAIYDVNQDKYMIIETPQELMEIYTKSPNAIWCFYNCAYDLYIFKAILLGYDPKVVNDFIIKEGRAGFEFSPEMNYKFPLITFDVKTNLDEGLKQLEAYLGDDIHESSVPFDLERPLTAVEIEQVQKYCLHDVKETFKVLKLRREDFVTNLNLINNFKLPRTYMRYTKGRLAVEILKAKRGNYSADQFNVTFPTNIKIEKYKHIVDWFKQACAEGNKAESASDIKNVYTNKLSVIVADCPHVFGWGGLHGALLKYHSTGRLINVDVASFYPSLIIEYGFNSRNIADKNLYTQIYHDRLKFKAEGNDLAKSYKLVLNSLYGQLKRADSRAYDPLMANNICITGQLFLLDLIEQAEKNNCGKLIQSNTDGVLFEIDNDEQYNRLMDVCNEWQKRTRMVLEVEEYQAIHQRDVNTYIIVDKDGKFKSKGALKKSTPLDNDLPIIKKAVIDYFAKGTPIRETIKGCDELIMFQKVYKLRRGAKKDYHAVQHNGVEQNLTVFRVFASTNQDDTTLYKLYKDKEGKVKSEKFAGCPEHAFIDNSDIKDKETPSELDKEWYIEQAYNELDKFYFDDDNKPQGGGRYVHYLSQVPSELFKLSPNDSITQQLNLTLFLKESKINSM